MHRTYIIAEAGVNHNGSVEMAKQMIDIAAKAGVDAIKFQTFRAANMVSHNAPKAVYQQRATRPGESQLDMLLRLELDVDQHRELAAYCSVRGIEFLSTPFDIDSVTLLVNDLRVKRIKISSGDITNGPLLLSCARTGRPIILSTGMSTLGEIESALAVLAFGYLNPQSNPSKDDFEHSHMNMEYQKILGDNVTLLHCTTEYPAPFEDVNLRAMETMASAFDLKIGYSDHTAGIAVAIAAVARGAIVIEKHFTLDRQLPGPDHQASIEPLELNVLVESIRQVEEALGNRTKAPMPSEIGNKTIARKSLVASREIMKGQLYSVENLASKRPGNGISPMKYWDLLGKPAPRKFAQDEMVEL